MAFINQIADLAEKCKLQARDIESTSLEARGDIEGFQMYLTEQSRLLADNAAMLAEWCAKPIGV